MNIFLIPSAKQVYTGHPKDRASGSPISALSELLAGAQELLLLVVNVEGD